MRTRLPPRSAAPRKRRSSRASPDTATRPVAIAPGRQRPRHANQRRPGIPKTAKGLRRKQELIAATARALNSHGFRELSAADIVAEAQAPVGLFYRYFRNKTEAVLAALDQLVTDFRTEAQIPGPAGDLFGGILTSHRSVLRLLSERRGLLSCYYSYDYGQPAFVRFFQEQTARFDRDIAAAAIQEAGCSSVVPADLAVLAHALTAMIDNFALRYGTGRDETPTLERAANIDVAWLTAMLRYRGLVCADPPGEASLPTFHINPAAGSASYRRVELQEPRLAAAREPHSRRSPKRSDSARTYSSLKRTALDLLNRLPYDDMRIADIEHTGRTTRGSIYHYFGEKRDLVLELLRERLAAVHLELCSVQARLEDQGMNVDVFEHLEALAWVFVQEFASNPGILRTVYQLEGRDADIGTLFRSYRRCWVDALVAVLARHTVRPADHRAVLDLIGYAMLAMVDRFAYDIYVAPFPRVADVFHRPDGVSAFIATAWYRMLFLANPSQTVPKPFAVLAALSKGATTSVRSGSSASTTHGHRDK